MGDDKIVEVLNVSRGMDGLSGEPTFAVQFGITLPKTDSRYSQYVKNGIPIPSFNVLTLFYGFDGVAPYRVGTKWKINVNNKGSLKLTEVVE
jgi:hypothetical protein